MFIIGVKSTLEVSLLKCFQEYCTLIYRDMYDPQISLDNVTNLVKDIKQRTINYANNCLKEKRETKLRNDYKEF